MRPDIIADPTGAIVLNDSLLVSDLHIGIEREVGLKRGANSEVILNKLKTLQDKYKINKLVLLGDVKHRFDLRDADLVRWFMKRVKEMFEDITIVGGNHDKGLGLLKDIGVNIVDKMELGNYVLEHGDKLEPNDKVLIIGHEHPVIELGDYFRSARYICFLDFGNVILMPAFNNISPGNNVLAYRFSSKYLNDKKWDAKVYVSDETSVYYAGTLREIAVKIYGDIPEI